VQESPRVATKTGVAKPSDFSKVIVDTTVQEKAAAFPTDAKLMHRARERLVRLANTEWAATFLAHTAGDAANAVLAAAGHNFSRLLAWLALLCAFFLDRPRLRPNIRKSTRRGLKEVLHG
jgi:hypothetical protein